MISAFGMAVCMGISGLYTYWIDKGTNWYTKATSDEE